MSKQQMIREILLAAQAGGCHLDGDLLFALAFRTGNELRKICSELNIGTEQ